MCCPEAPETVVVFGHFWSEKFPHGSNFFQKLIAPNLLGPPGSRGPGIHGFHGSPASASPNHLILNRVYGSTRLHAIVACFRSNLFPIDTLFPISPTESTDYSSILRIMHIMPNW